MTIHLENEIVASAWNPVTRVCSYTLERDGKRWTVQIHESEFSRQGGTPVRRAHLARKLETAMLGREDA
jgi:hypothetical protein